MKKYFIRVITLVSLLTLIFSTLNPSMLTAANAAELGTTEDQLTPLPMDLTSEEMVDDVYSEVQAELTPKVYSTQGTTSTTTTTTTSTKSVTKEQIQSLLEALEPGLTSMNQMFTEGKLDQAASYDEIGFRASVEQEDGSIKYVSETINLANEKSELIKYNNQYFPQAQVSLATATSGTAGNVALDAVLGKIVDDLYSKGIHYIDETSLWLWILKAAAIKKGWVAFEIPYNNDLWFYKNSFFVFAANQWVQSKATGKWFWMKKSTIMFDPYWDNATWKVINGKWYEFVDGGSNSGAVVDNPVGWILYKPTNRWIYRIPGDLGLYTNTQVTINGVKYYFDKNGYASWYENGVLKY